MISGAVSNITRGRFYYGWIVVALVFLVYFAGGGLGGYVLMVLLKPISVEMHWSRASILGASSMAALIAGASAPIIGRIIDRHGTRGLIVWGAFAQGVILILLSHVTSLWQLYVLYGLGGALAQGEMSGNALQAAIANWFIRNRGRAMAFSMIGLSIGGTVFAPLTAFIASGWGWRNAWIVYAFIIWGAVMVPVWLLMRRRPEDMGLQPDGTSPDPTSTARNTSASKARSVPAGEVNVTLGEALRSRSLWLLILFSTLFNFALMGVFLNLPSYFSDMGFTAAVAATAMGAFAFAGSVSRLFWGFLAERFPVRHIFTILLFATAATLSLVVAMSSLDFMQRVWVLFPIAATLGFLGGGSTVLRNILWPDYFGRLHIGSIRGVVQPFESVSSAVGPLFSAFVFDVTGSYSAAFGLFVVLYAASAFLIRFAEPPRRRSGLMAPEAVHTDAKKAR